MKKEMNEQLHYESIIDQYASDSGIVFYRNVMGAGSPVIHYGLYREKEDSMQAATLEATRSLWAHGERWGSKSPCNILELGSGLGGSAHWLAKETGATVQCVDLCERMNQMNDDTASQMGIGAQIHTWTGSYEHLPEEWNGQFDLVWSQEAFCHAYQRERVFSEAHRCLRDGGMIVFTDIMLSDKISPQQATTYSSLNAIARWSSLPETLRALRKCGFRQVSTDDWSDALPRNFEEMLQQMNRERDALLKTGVSANWIEDYETSLRDRLHWGLGEVLQWHAIVAIR